MNIKRSNDMYIFSYKGILRHKLSSILSGIIFVYTKQVKQILRSHRHDFSFKAL